MGYKTSSTQICIVAILLASAITWMGFTKYNHLSSGIRYANALTAVIIFIVNHRSSDGSSTKCLEIPWKSPTLLTHRGWWSRRWKSEGEGKQAPPSPPKRQGELDLLFCTNWTDSNAFVPVNYYRILDIFDIFNHYGYFEWLNGCLEELK